MNDFDYIVSQSYMTDSNNDTLQTHSVEFVVKELPTVGCMLKERRTRYNLTQTSIAEIAGITITEISRIESGVTKKPSRKVLQALTPFIGISYPRLLFYAGYSGIIDDDIYYNKKGEIIPHQEIVASIYKADCDLLEILKDIDKLSIEDIDIIKKLILLMKVSEKGILTEEPLHPIKSIFNATKTFLTQQLTNLISMFHICSQHV